VGLRKRSARTRSIVALCLSLCAWSSSPANALGHEVAVRFDPAQTDIHWTLGATLHSVHGTFKLKSGWMTFDPSTGVARGELLANLPTGNSGDDKRDRTMHERVLESGKYPQASFLPAAIHLEETSGGIQTFTTTGTFAIHGSDHPMQIKVNLQVTGTQVSATAHFQVPYVEWGMHDPSTFILRVAKVVNVDVTSIGTVEAQR
jgi:polyisoprenoid-binding protein YceI